MRNSPVLLLVLPWAVACAQGGVAPAPVAPDSVPATVEGGAHVAWASMSRGQRIDTMIKTVLPRMKGEFVAFDATRFARMDCATCHGEGAGSGAYAIPNPKLPKLSATDSFARHRQLTPEITHFMLEKVAPDMATLLDVPPYDPITHRASAAMPVTRGRASRRSPRHLRRPRHPVERRATSSRSVLPAPCCACDRT